MLFTIPGCKLVPSLRFSTQRFHLTYAALFPGELPFDGILDALQDWAGNHGGLREYAIGREVHAQPADPAKSEHYHVYFKFGSRNVPLQRGAGDEAFASARRRWRSRRFSEAPVMKPSLQRGAREEAVATARRR